LDILIPSPVFWFIDADLRIKRCFLSTVQLFYFSISREALTALSLSNGPATA
jgi:hypothetical protein